MEKRLRLFDLKEWCRKYDDDPDPNKVKDRAVEEKYKKLLSERLYLKSVEEFIEIIRWKSSHRIIHHAKENSASDVEEITKLALSAESERARIGILQSLDGVSWPVASAILHFAYPEKYPILDFRALWSLNHLVDFKIPPLLQWRKNYSYNFAFWKEYCETIRKIAQKTELSIRKVDKALWQFSKKHQLECECQVCRQ